MKYKVGNKVRINNQEWYEDNCNRYGVVECGNYEFFEPMNEYCGKVVTIIKVDDCYRVDIDKGSFCWTDEMIEGLVEEETKPEPKFKVGDKVILDPYPCKITDVHWRDSLHGFVYTVRGTDFGKTVKEADLVFDERRVPNTNEIIQLIKNDWNNFKDRYDIPDDYHFVDKNGNEVNISNIVLEKKKTKYPKTYEECCKVMNYCYNPVTIKTTHKEELIRKFQFLLLYRDAYWKIAGEEMVLGKPWESDYSGTFEHGSPIKYVIYNEGTHIIKERKSSPNHILSFPTAEMRDAFYENFKELIEKCKELL